MRDWLKLWWLITSSIQTLLKRLTNVFNSLSLKVQPPSLAILMINHCAVWYSTLSVCRSLRCPAIQYGLFLQCNLCCRANGNRLLWLCLPIRFKLSIIFLVSFLQLYSRVFPITVLNLWCYVCLSDVIPPRWWCKNQGNWLCNCSCFTITTDPRSRKRNPS